MPYVLARTVLCAGQGSNWAVETPASASSRSQTSKTRFVRDLEIPMGTKLFLHLQEDVSFSSERLVQLLPCFAASERALSGPKLQVVCAAGLPEHWGCWLSLCCFLLYCGNLLSGCCVVSLFPFLHVRAQGSLY